MNSPFKKDLIGIIIIKIEMKTPNLGVVIFKDPVDWPQKDSIKIGEKVKLLLLLLNSYLI